MPRREIPKDRRKLNLGDKIELLSYYNETKCSIRKLAKKFNIGKTQAGLIIKKQHALFELWLSGNPANGHKRLSTLGLQIDKMVYEWYLEMKNVSVEVTGPMLQSKALELSKNLGNDEFKASNGWLARFLKRHEISFKELKDNPDKSKHNDVTDNASLSTVCVWSKDLASILPKYSADDIFSAIETGLFFKAIPDITSDLIKRSCSCGTLSAQRMTILFCANMTGMKEKPCVIADIPEDEVENLKTVEIDIESNNKAWLTQDIMTKWLKEMDNRMVDQKRKIILFLNHTLPQHNCQLKNIETIYFPSYLSSSSYSVNKGIIQNFKIFYRHKLLKHLITLDENDENYSSLDQAISISQALTWINDAWNELSKSVIQKCFEELCFNTYVTIDKASDNETSTTLNDVSDLLCAYDSNINAIEYVSIDDSLVTEGEEPKTIEILVDADQIKHMFVDSDEEICTESKNVIPNYDEVKHAFTVSDEKMCTESRNVISNYEHYDNLINFYSESLSGLRQLEQFYLSQNDLNGILLAKQLITHHENVINSKKDK